jgi:hypothetical protein
VSRFRGAYPKDWKTLSNQIKEEAGWRCIRCGHVHDHKAGYTLTVHHLDNDKSNLRHWNLVPLCQRCHLHIQSKVRMERVWMFEHSEWFRPYVAGYYAYQNGLPDDRESVTARMDEYLALGQAVIP